MSTAAATPKKQATLTTKDAMALFVDCMDMFEQMEIVADFLMARVNHAQYNQLQPSETDAEQLTIALNMIAATLAGFRPAPDCFFSANLNLELPETDPHGVWGKFKSQYLQDIGDDNVINIDLETGMGGELEESINKFERAGIDISHKKYITVEEEKETFIGSLFSGLLKTPLQKTGEQKLKTLFA